MSWQLELNGAKKMDVKLPANIQIDYSRKFQ